MDRPVCRPVHLDADKKLEQDETVSPQSVHSQSSASGTSTHQIPIDWMAVHVVNVGSCIPIDDHVSKGSLRGKQTSIQTVGKNVGFWFRQDLGWKIGQATCHQVLDEMLQLVFLQIGLAHCQKSNGWSCVAMPPHPPNKARHSSNQHFDQLWK